MQKVILHCAAVTILFAGCAEPMSPPPEAASSAGSSGAVKPLSGPPVQRSSAESNASSEAETLDTEGTVETPPRWSVGDKLEYELIKERRRDGEGGKPLQGGSRTDLHLEVLEKLADGYVIGWTYGDTQLITDAPLNDPLTEQLGSIMSGLQARLQLDDSPSVVGIENWRELQRKAQDVIELLVGQLQKSGIPASQQQQVRNQVSALFTTEAQISNLFTREAQMFFLPVGGSYSSTPSNYEDQLPNAFGGEPFPTKAYFQLKGVDRKANQVVIIWHQEMEPEATKRIMNKMIATLTAQQGQPPEALQDFSVEDHAEFVVDLATGWPVRLSHIRTSRTGGRVQTETMKINRKEFTK